LEALTKWVGNIPSDVLEDIDQIAPMIKILGYDTKLTFVSYGNPDPEVMQNTNQLQENQTYWNLVHRNIVNLAKKTKEAH